LSNSPRDRIAAAFDRELAHTPVPPSLRAQAVHSVMLGPRVQVGPKHSWAIAMVAAVLAIAVVVTLVVGSRALRSSPIPAKPSAPPAARTSGSVAYDEASGQLVLFGGSVNQSTAVNETWTWDSKGWTLHHLKTTPTAREQAAMAYDPIHHNVVLFGGMALLRPSGKGGPSAQGGLAPVTDTWTWDGRSWTMRATPHEPAFNSIWAPAAAFDPVSGMVLAFGYPKSGTGEAAGPGPSQTWAWSGSDWVQLHPRTTPAVGQATLVFDGKHLLLLGQGGPVRGRFVTATWMWDGTNWTLLTPTIDLPSTGWTSAAYDPQLGRVILLNGETWAWDGSTWSRQHPTNGPSGVGYVVYDTANKRILSWGDQVLSSGNADLWAWGGDNWKLLQAGPAYAGQQYGADYLGVMSPAAAEAAVRSVVKNTSPVLMPASLPAGMDAKVFATTDGFSIEYRSDQRDKDLTWGIVVPNPPPGGSHSSDTHVTFRGGTAEYFVFDTTVPQSTRWLMWIGPGTMAVPQTKAPGVPYFLSAVGLTDQEFWQIANSLK
jgi:hypothetical protein